MLPDRGMVSKLIIAAFLLIQYVLSPVVAKAQDASLDAPHDVQGCLSCHFPSAFDAPNLIPGGCDSVYVSVCEACHNGTTPSHLDGEALEDMSVHSSEATSNRYGTWYAGCKACHNQHKQEQDRAYGTSYGKFVQVVINLEQITEGEDGSPLKSGKKPVKFIRQTGPNSFVDGDDVYDGVCQVCHTRTNHFRNTGEVNVTGTGYDHTSTVGTNCMQCHSHSNGFMHGGGSGTGCVDCHGHDSGTLFDPDMSVPYEPGSEPSLGAGTVQSHSTHTETDSDDRKGPGIYCNTCHNINKFPLFRSVADPDAELSLDDTDVCDACHSEYGSYNGLDDPVIGAKQIWHEGAYVATDDPSLQAGKEKWCAGCHDETPSQIQSVYAPNVIGDEDATVGDGFVYGNIASGWGFYKTGHGLDSGQVYPASGGITPGGGKECSACHDYSNAHIDGKARSFDCSDGCDPDEYREYYRLKMVNGRNPMEIPLATNIAPSANNYMLCFSNTGCHLPDKYLTTSTSMETVYRDDDVLPADDLNPNAGWSEPLNAHEYHLNFKAGMGGRMVPDWRSTVNGTFSCIVCHNVHGSTQLAMVRDGKLVSQTPGINREPGMKVLYTNIADYKTASEPTPAALTLDNSTGTFWDGNTSDNLCSDCHGNPGGSVGRIYRHTTPPVAQQAPTLGWTGETGYVADGADPDAGEQGSVFHFRVEYTDVNHDLPTSIQVWLDLDGDGYEDEEKHDLWEADFDDHDTADGKIYRKLIEVDVIPGTYDYRFYARDRNADATGAPVTTAGTITVTAAANQAPVLSWTEETDYLNDGVDPDFAVSGTEFTFRVTYEDTVNEAPTVQEVWIDLNDDGDFEDTNEKQAMAVDGGDGDYSNGEIFTYSRNIPYPAGSLNGVILYRFYFKDSDGAEAVGEPTSTSTFTVRESLSDCDLTVCASSCTDTTIPSAVAASVDGDIVCVYDGTWGPFAFDGKNITVRSVNGPESTIIDGGGGAAAVSFNWSSSDSTLKGFTVTNANKGVTINNSEAVIVECIIENNSTGGIYADNTSSDPVIIDNTMIRDNTGPGIHNSNSSFVATISDSVFSGNTAANGAGIYAQNGAGTYTINGCEFLNNTATGNGGAADLGNRATLNLSDSSIIGNSAGGDGGGFYSYGTPGLVNFNVERTVFAGNQATNGGGVGSGPGGGAFTFTNCIFSGNRADNYGGGMVTSESSSTTDVFTNCTIAGNSADEGGGIYSKTWTVAALKIHNSIVWGNESRSSDNNQIEGPIILDPGSTYYAEVQYTDIGQDQQYSVFSNQVGNMYVDPQFFYPVPASSAPTSESDYHIQATSPVIDQALVASPPADDIDGEVRPNPSSTDIDMGADEYYYYSVDYDMTDTGKATAVAADTATINITMPYSNDYNGNNTYTLEYKLSSSGTWLDWGTNPKAHVASQYTDTIIGLTAGETYDVRMTYNDPDGVSGANPQTVTVVMPDNQTATGTATAVMADLVSIDITMPYSNDYNANNTYTVDYKLSSTGSWTNWVTDAAHTASQYTDTITGLTAYETYDVRMTYNDGDGVNGANPQTVTSIQLAYNETTVGTATASKASDTSIDITMPYTDDYNGDNTYTVDYKLSSAGSWTNWVTDAAHTAIQYIDTITGLAAGTYDVRMTYNDTDGVNGTNPQIVTGIELASLSCTTTVSVSGNLQPAITAANDGDTICVDEATYSENLTFNFTPDKNITVIAIGAVANTIIQGTGANAAVVTFSDSGTDSSTVLEGFTINNQSGSSAARGIYISGGASPSINNSVIEGHSLNNNSGGGVYISGGSPTFTDTIIQNNAANNTPAVGGGVYSDSSSPTFNNCQILNNSTANGGIGGGGVYINGGSPQFNGTVISSNSATSRDGGGLYLNAAATTMTETTINSNTSNGNNGGGGIYMTGGTLAMSESYVMGNRTYGPNNNSDGGGIKIASGTATIINSVIAGNVTESAWQADGGGIFNAGTLNLYFSTVADNYSYNHGGGIYAGNVENIYNSIVWGNSSHHGTPGIQGTPENLYLTETVSNPEFVSRSAAGGGSPTINGEYRLCNGAGDPAGSCTGSSPCIDTGDATNAPATDIVGTGRFVDVAGKGDGVADYDKGAYEYTP